MEGMEAVVAVITAVITLVKTLMDLFGKKKRSRERKYYNCVLRPYVVTKKDKKVRAVDFVKRRVRRNNDNIPKYVFYLIDKNREEELDKVLLYDYISLYPNGANQLNVVAEFAIKFVHGICYMGALFFMVFGGFLLSLSLSVWVVNIVSSLVVEGVKIAFQELILWENVSRIIYSILCLFGGVLLMKVCVKNEVDRYTIEKKKIEKKIEAKLKYYDKDQGKFWI